MRVYFLFSVPERKNYVQEAYLNTNDEKFLILQTVRKEINLNNEKSRRMLVWTCFHLGFHFKNYLNSQ